MRATAIQTPRKAEAGADVLVSELSDLAGRIKSVVAGLEAERDRLKRQLRETESENEKLEAKISDLEEKQDPDLSSAIDAFLDECERTGARRFSVPQSDRANQAIVALHNAVGRNP